jgi:hypothetical protein
MFGLDDFVRRTRDAIIGGFGSHEAQDGNGIIYIRDGPRLNHNRGPMAALRDMEDMLHGYEDVEFDYGQARMGFGGELFVNEGGHTDRGSTPPEVVDPEPYKEPTTADKGYSRNLKEDDMAVCPCCGTELALGGDDPEQQIWVAKQCGHVSTVCKDLQTGLLTMLQVYCGECAGTRHLPKDWNKRHQRLAKQRKAVHALKQCLAEGCKSRLATKNAMIQIYL